MKSLARSYVYWLSIDADVQQIVCECRPYAQAAKAQIKTTTCPHRLRWSNRWILLPGYSGCLFQMARNHLGHSPRNLRPLWLSRSFDFWITQHNNQVKSSGSSARQMESNISVQPHITLNPLVKVSGSLTFSIADSRNLVKGKPHHHLST